MVKMFISTNFGGSSLIEEYGGRLQFKVTNKSLTLAKVFGFIEERKEELGIEDYSYSQTTLEQVFISFAKKQYEE